MIKLLAILFSGLASLSLHAADADNMVWGGYNALGFNSGNAATTTLGTQNRAVAGCQIISKAITISHAGFVISSKTGTPANNSYEIELQTTGTDGLPSGTDLGGGSPTAVTFTPTATGSLWVALTNSYAATAGEMVCVVVTRVAATDASNKIESVYRSGDEGQGGSALGYPLVFDGAAWIKNNGSGSRGGFLPFAVKNSDASLVVGQIFNTFPTTNIGGTVESGMSWTMPSHMCSTYKVKGVRWNGKTPTTGTDLFGVRLYTTPLGTPVAVQSFNASPSTFDVDNVLVGATANLMLTVYFPGTLATLSCGTKYGIAISTTTAASMNIQGLAQAAVADFNGWPYKQRTALISRTVASYPPAGDTTTFTETTTTRPLMELILDEITPAGGSGFILQ